MLRLLESRGFAPRIAVWEITLACDMRCRHCGSRAGKGRVDELSTEEALALCGALADEGCVHLTLSGGEPLLREDWPRLAEALTSRGVLVNAISNGRRFDRALAEQVKAAGLHDIGFSIDGLEQTHTYVRRVAGHWRKLLGNFELCRELGIPSAAITMVHRRNLHELPELHGILAERGVEVWQLQIGVPSGNMADQPDMVLEPRQVLELVPMVAELRRRPGPRVDVGDNIGYYGGYEAELRADECTGPRGYWTGCQAGCSVVGIESDGAIKGCLSLPSARNHEDAFIEGTIRERSFHEIWHDPDAFAYNRRFAREELEGFCRTCEFAEVCRGGCSWAAYAFGGRFDSSRYCYHRLLAEEAADGQAG